MADTLQWVQLHLDYLHSIKVSWCDAYLELYRVYCAGRPVGLPESAVMLGEVQNGVYKGSGRCFTRFLRCVEVSHDLD